LDAPGVNFICKLPPTDVDAFRDGISDNFRSAMDALVTTQAQKAQASRPLPSLSQCRYAAATSRSHAGHMQTHTGPDLHSRMQAKVRRLTMVDCRASDSCGVPALHVSAFQAWNPDDRKMIFAAIEETVGFDQLNAKVGLSHNSRSINSRPDVQHALRKTRRHTRVQ